MTVVQIHSLMELIEFLSKVKDPGEWYVVDGADSKIDVSLDDSRRKLRVSDVVLE